MLRKLPHAKMRKGLVCGDRRREKFPAPDCNDSLSSASKRGETWALRRAMYIEGRGEEKSCECPYSYPPTTKALLATSPPCSSNPPPLQGASRTSCRHFTFSNPWTTW